MLPSRAFSPAPALFLRSLWTQRTFPWPALLLVVSMLPWPARAALLSLALSNQRVV